MPGMRAASAAPVTGTFASVTGGISAAQWPARRRSRTARKDDASMDWKLEVVVVPVTDVDRAKRFYTEQAGFFVDHDTRISDLVRFVQLTPPGRLAGPLPRGRRVTRW